MKWFVKENAWLNGISHGWGNGYVLIPVGNKLHGVKYSDIDVDVHYGLTFSSLVTEEMQERWPELSKEDIGSWCVGFDTCHYNDDIYNWPKEAVEEETKMLRDNLLTI